jgi:hypothetical protein
MAECAPPQLQSGKNRRRLQCQSGSHQQVQGLSRHIRPWKDKQDRENREFCVLSVPILGLSRFDPSNVGASVRAKLLHRSRTEHSDYQVLSLATLSKGCCIASAYPHLAIDSF